MDERLSRSFGSSERTRSGFQPRPESFGNTSGSAVPRPHAGQWWAKSQSNGGGVSPWDWKQRVPPTEWFALTRGMSCTMYHWQGAHLKVENGVAGAWFSVWAPNAVEVCVINDANGWRHGAFYLNGSEAGVWSGFVPGVREGERYKYRDRKSTRLNSSHRH